MTTGNFVIAMVINSGLTTSLTLLINHYGLRIRGQDISPMLNWLKTLDLLIQATKEGYNNVCK